MAFTLHVDGGDASSGSPLLSSATAAGTSDSGALFNAGSTTLFERRSTALPGTPPSTTATDLDDADAEAAAAFGGFSFGAAMPATGSNGPSRARTGGASTATPASAAGSLTSLRDVGRAPDADEDCFAAIVPFDSSAAAADELPPHDAAEPSLRSINHRRATQAVTRVGGGAVVDTTTAALRGVGKASKALASLRQALEAAEAGLPTPRELRTDPLVRLPRQTAVDDGGLSEVERLANEELERRFPASAARNLRKPLPRSYFRVAADTESDEDEGGAPGTVMTIVTPTKALRGRRPSAYRAQTTSASAYTSRVGSRVQSATATPRGASLEPPVGGVKLPRRSLGLGSSTSSMPRAGDSASSPFSWYGGGGGSSSATALLPSRLRASPATSGTISAYEAEAIIEEHQATASAELRVEIESRLLDYRGRRRAELERAEVAEAEQRDAEAADPNAFRKAVEAGASAFAHRVEARRRQVALKRAAVNHHEVTMRDRLKELTEIAREKAVKEEKERIAIAAQVFQSRLRVLVGQVEGEEEFRRCRLEAEEARALAVLETAHVRVQVTSPVRSAAPEQARV